MFKQALENPQIARTSCTSARLLTLGSELISALEWEWKDLSISARPRYRARVNPLNQMRFRLTRLNLSGKPPPFFINPSVVFVQEIFKGKPCLTISEDNFIRLNSDRPTWAPPPAPRVILPFLLNRPSGNLGVYITLGVCASVDEDALGIPYCTFETFKRQFMDVTPFPPPYPHACPEDHINHWNESRSSKEVFNDESGEIVRMHVSFTSHALYSKDQCHELHFRYVTLYLYHGVLVLTYIHRIYSVDVLKNRGFDTSHSHGRNTLGGRALGTNPNPRYWTEIMEGRASHTSFNFLTA